MSLIISLRSEILKTKRTAAFYFTLIGAGIIPLMFLISIATHGLPENERTAADPINSLFSMASEVISVGIFPLFVILVCTLLPQIEYRNAAWKQVLTSPQTKANIFAAKYLNIHLLLLLFLVANHLFMWVVVFTAHFALPKLNILDQPFDFYKVIVNNAHMYASVLALTAIQFWIGLRAKNFLVPIAIGLAAWFIGSLMVFEYGSSVSVYFPYCFQGIRFSKFRSQTSQVEWTSAGYAVLLLALGFLDFEKRKMTR